MLGLSNGRVAYWGGPLLRIIAASPQEQEGPAWPVADVERTVALPPSRFASWSGTGYWSTLRPAESTSHTIQLWDSDSGELVANLAGHRRWLAGVRPAGQARLVSWAEYETHACLWDSRSGEHVATLKHKGIVRGVEQGLDGRVLSWDADNLYIWNARSGARERAIETGVSDIKGVLILVERRVLCHSSGPNLIVRDLASLDVLATLEHAEPVCGVRVASDGRLFAWSARELSLWDLTVRRRIRSYQPSPGRIDTAFPLAGGRVVAWGRGDRALRLWAPDGSLQPPLQGHQSEIKNVAELPNGRLASWSENETVLRLWDTRSGALLAVCEGHAGRILGAAALPRSAAVVSWSFDETLRLWHSATGEPLGAIPEQTAALRHSDWVAARVKAAPEAEQLARAGMVGWAQASTAGISPDQDNAPCAAMWHADTGVRAWELLPDGTFAVSLKGGQVVFLKLYRGGRRIELADARP